MGEQEVMACQRLDRWGRCWDTRRRRRRDGTWSSLWGRASLSPRHSSPPPRLLLSASSPPPSGTPVSPGGRVCLGASLRLVPSPLPSAVRRTRRLRMFCSGWPRCVADDLAGRRPSAPADRPSGCDTVRASSARRTETPQSTAPGGVRRSTPTPSLRLHTETWLKGDQAGSEHGWHTLWDRTEHELDDTSAVFCHNAAT